jgi:NADPH-dependent 2,4-dienoyl-CoA reductase/sulfur reductase-like enzyme
MPEMMTRGEAEDFDAGLPADGPPPDGWSAACPRVVVIGGGFAGLRAVRVPVRVILNDRTALIGAALAAAS